MQQPSLVISLDDYYLSRTERGRLSRSEHRLFAQRGVPGTHDFELLMTHLQAVLDPNHADIHLPVFDKYSDQRLRDRRTVKAGFNPAIVFVEGWVAGVPPQPGHQLLSAVNELESSQDSDGEWRHRVNAHLYDYFNTLDPLINQRWHFKAPDWNSVVQWRWQQEQNGHQKLLSSVSEVADFLDHFQRLCQHMDNTCSQWANSIIELDTDHMPAFLSKK
jgi:D-glycerate 3-kinase